VHRAGEKLFVDFPGEKIPIYDRRTGALTLNAELFVAVAGASNYLFAEAFASQELLYWVTAHTHAFEFMGGCHEIVVCDNLRSGVTRPHRYEPDVNATYQEMAAHYGVAIIPTRTYKPRDKTWATDCTSMLDDWDDVVPSGWCPAGGVKAERRKLRSVTLEDGSLIVRLGVKDPADLQSDRPP
jgi:hypothetical protein